MIGCEQLCQTLQIWQFVYIKKGVEQMNLEVLALSRFNGHLRDNRRTHRNVAEDIVWLAHGNQVVTTIIGRTKHDICEVESRFCIIDDVLANLGRI